MFCLSLQKIVEKKVSASIQLEEWPEVSIRLIQDGSEADVEVVHWQLNDSSNQKSDWATGWVSIDIDLAGGIQLIELFGKFRCLDEAFDQDCPRSDGEPHLDLTDWEKTAVPMMRGDIRGSVIDCYSDLGIWMRGNRVGLSFGLGKPTNRVYVCENVALEFDERRTFVGMLFDSLQEKELKYFKSLLLLSVSGKGSGKGSVL